MRTVCFIYLCLCGLIATLFQALTAPFLVNRRMLLSNTSDNPLIKPVAMSRGDVLSQKSIAGFCSICVTAHHKLLGFQLGLLVQCIHVSSVFP